MLIVVFFSNQIHAPPPRWLRLTFWIIIFLLYVVGICDCNNHVRGLKEMFDDVPDYTEWNWWSYLKLLPECDWNYGDSLLARVALDLFRKQKNTRMYQKPLKEPRYMY